MKKKPKLVIRTKSLSDSAVNKLIKHVKASTRKYWLHHIADFRTHYGYIGRHIAKELRKAFNTSHVVYRSHLWVDSNTQFIRTFTFHVVVRDTGSSYKSDFRNRGMIRAEHFTFVFDVISFSASLPDNGNPPF